MEVLSADQVEHIHRSSLRLLAEVGMTMHDRWARERLAHAGCQVDHASMRVRFEPAFIEEQIAKAPAGNLGGAFFMRLNNLRVHCKY